MSNILAPNQFLDINSTLTSTNGQYQLLLQSDGNLVVYHLANHHPVWASGTDGSNAMRAIMQSNGNFVLYDFLGDALWASGTNGKPGSFLIIQDDGNLVIYQPNLPVWTTGTNQ